MKKEEMAARIAAFFDGTTSLAEERELYEMFRSGEYPAESECYRALFLRFGEGFAGPATISARCIRRRWAGAAVVAAATAIVGGLFLAVPTELRDSSFVRRGGISSRDGDAIEEVAMRLEADFARYEEELASRDAAFGRLDDLYERKCKKGTLK